MGLKGGLDLSCRKFFQMWKQYIKYIKGLKSKKKQNFQYLKTLLCVQQIPIFFLYSIPCSSDLKNYNSNKINNLSQFF